MTWRVCNNIIYSVLNTGSRGKRARRLPHVRVVLLERGVIVFARHVLFYSRDVETP